MKTTIAVIDSGIDYTNKTLCSFVKKGYYLKQYNNSIVIKNNYNDDYGHGTSCVKIITDVCHNVNIHILKIFSKNNIQPQEKTLIKALELCLYNNVNLINISFGAEPSFFKYKNKIKNLLKECKKNNTFVIASNPFDNKKHFPASFDYVFEVKPGNFSPFMHYLEIRNKKLLFYSYSGIQQILHLNGKIICSSGISYSTALLSGILSKIINKNLNASYKDLVEILSLHFKIKEKKNV